MRCLQASLLIVALSACGVGTHGGGAPGEGRGTPSLEHSSLELSSQSIWVDDPDEVSLSVLVQNSFGEPLAGIEVRFTSSVPSDRIHPQTGVTSEDGTLTASFLGSEVGSRIVQASMGGLSLDQKLVLQCRQNLLGGHPEVLRGLGSARVGDFDGDGKDDLLAFVACSATGDEDLRCIAFHRGLGAGKFEPSRVVAEFRSSYAWSVVVADWNRDGIDDFGVGRPTYDPRGPFFVFEAYLGQEDGRFRQVESTSLSSPLVTSADIDGDGLPDLVIYGSSSPIGTGVVESMRGRGDGTFRSAVVSNVPFWHNGLCAGDVDGDGYADLIQRWGSSHWFGDGTGTFSLGELPSDRRVIACEDLDGDGSLDLVFEAGDEAGRGPQISWGHEFHRLVDVKAPTSIGEVISRWSSTGDPITILAVLDLDGDGQRDLLVQYAHWEEWTLAALRGGAGGSFGPEPIFLAPSPFPVIGKGRFTEEGAVDLLFSSSSGVGVLPVGEDGVRPFVPRAGGRESRLPKLVLADDFNGDGRLDFVSAYQSDIEVSLGPPAGEWRSRSSYIVPFDVLALGAMDLDGDEIPDVIASLKDGSLVARLSSRPSSFSPLMKLPDLIVHEIATFDWNGDGREDLIVSGSSTKVLIRQEDGKFEEASVLGREARKITSIDFDGDGDVDVAFLAGRELWVLPGDGKGGYSLGSPVFYAMNLPVTAFDLLAADLDFDGKPELLALGEEEILIYRGRQRESLRLPPYFMMNGGSMTAFDANRDGSIDLFVRGYFGLIGVFWGLPDQSFRTFASYPIVAASYPLPSAPLDGVPALALASWTENVQVSVSCEAPRR